MPEVSNCSLTCLSWFGCGQWSLIHLWSKLWPSIFAIVGQDIKPVFKVLVGAEGSTGVWHLDLDLNMYTSLWYPYIPNTSLKVHRTTVSFKSYLLTLMGAGGSWLGFGILILIQIWSLALGTQMFRILVLYLILKVQRTSMSFKSWFVALDDAGGSLLGLGIVILIWILSPAFDLNFSFLS